MASRTENGFTSLLQQVARSQGIEPIYRDATGKRHTVSSETLKHLLASLGLQIGSMNDGLKARAEARSRPWKVLLDQVLVFDTSKRRQEFALSVPLGDEPIERVTIQWQLQGDYFASKVFRCTGQDRLICASKRISGVRYVRLILAVAEKIPLGYYRLTVQVRLRDSRLEGQAFVIAAPPTCYTPSGIHRAWGLAVQLHGLRSRTNWGVGDFHDLRRIVRWAGKSLKADAVGIPPLHPPVPGVWSPYSPSSRLFLNPLFLHVESIPEFRTTPAVARLVHTPSFQAERNRLKDEPLIHYEQVNALKSRLYEVLYHAFTEQHVRKGTSRARAFDRYLRREGLALERYAMFQVLSERFHTHVWRQWPKEFQDPRSPSVRRFGEQYRDRIRFHAYLQWQCERQLQAVLGAAERERMAFGLYVDFPVGIHPDGADAWAFQSQLAPEITIGAPPDTFNRAGQNWGLMAAHPSHLRAAGYQFFIETIRRNMRFGGVLRIDHALGLFRKFWIPAGESGSQGAYIRLPVDELLAILAVESTKHRVVLIGEDLGNVTPAIRRRLLKAGLLSYRLMLFEKRARGTYRLPNAYPEQAAVSVTTHDLPTFAGFWAGRDIELKEQMGLYPSARESALEWEHRGRDRLAIWKALRTTQGSRPAASDPVPLWATPEFRQAVYKCLATAPSRFLILPLEDLLGEFETPNFPGVPHGAYPSWRLKTTKDIDQIIKDRSYEAFVQHLRRGRVGKGKA